MWKADHPPTAVFGRGLGGHFSFSFFILHCSFELRSCSRLELAFGRGPLEPDPSVDWVQLLLDLPEGHPFYAPDKPFDSMWSQGTPQRSLAAMKPAHHPLLPSRFALQPKRWRRQARDARPPESAGYPSLRPRPRSPHWLSQRRPADRHLKTPPSERQPPSRSEIAALPSRPTTRSPLPKPRQQRLADRCC